MTYKKNIAGGVATCVLCLAPNAYSAATTPDAITITHHNADPIASATIESIASGSHLMSAALLSAPTPGEYKQEQHTLLFKLKQQLGKHSLAQQDCANGGYSRLEKTSPSQLSLSFHQCHEADGTLSNGRFQTVSSDQGQTESISYHQLSRDLPNGDRITLNGSLTIHSAESSEADNDSEHNIFISLNQTRFNHLSISLEQNGHSSNETLHSGLITTSLRSGFKRQEQQASLFFSDYTASLSKLVVSGSPYQGHSVSISTVTPARFSALPAHPTLPEAGTLAIHGAQDTRIIINAETTNPDTAYLSVNHRAPEETSWAAMNVSSLLIRSERSNPPHL